jgi:hypothetical protein
MYTSPPGNWDDGGTYYLYSAVTGKVITELNSAGERVKTNVYMGGTIICSSHDVI